MSKRYCLDNLGYFFERVWKTNKNYTKINDTEIANIYTHALKTFFNGGNTTIPTLNDTVKIIDSNDNLNLLISKTSNLKNIYKVGEKVLHDSTFYITNNDICYNNIPASEKGLYTGCTVCSINPSNNYMSSKNKTNIESICLYNDSENKIDKTIPTSNDCEGICIGRTWNYGCVYINYGCVYINYGQCI